MDRKWLVPSLVVVLIALYLGLVLDNSRRSKSDSTRTTSSSSDAALEETKPQQQHQAEYALYVIGDLHGDAHCARYWVEQTGLIHFEDSMDSQEWTWTDETSSLLFLGDYIDKGPTSLQTVEFVKALTTKFPNHVTALMGNHEMELLRDRQQLQRWGPNADFFQLPYASVHPGEYLNFVTADDTDHVVVDALYNASLELYGLGRYKTMINPSVDEEKSILNYINEDIRQVVKERLSQYQEIYLSAFASGTDLGMWLEQRPLMHLHNGTMLFVHGGVRPEAASFLAARAASTNVGVGASIDEINQLLAANSHHDKLNQFLDETPEGNVIYDMLGYRGNLEEGACDALKYKTLPTLGLSLIGLGHTPSESIRILCSGSLLALDSALGRWFRNSGNEYCRGTKQQTSSNGRFRCHKMNSQCQGQIVRITGYGHVEVIGEQSY